MWDKWVDRLSLLYNPGPNVTVDEWLVGFRGPFRHYMPSKLLPVMLFLLMHGTCKFIQGSQMEEPLREKQGTRVVLDMPQGLSGHNITCDNFFLHHTAWDGGCSKES